MKTKDIEQKLKLLVKLCTETEPTLDDIKSIREDAETVTGAVDELFTEDMIQARQIYNQVRDGEYDGSVEVTGIMREANKIWKMRNKWDKDGINGNLEEIEMIEAIEDFIAQGQKINAIKLYRTDMQRIFSQDVTLREAKDYIDKLGVDLKRRGIIK